MKDDLQGYEPEQETASSHEKETVRKLPYTFQRRAVLEEGVNNHASVEGGDRMPRCFSW